MAPPAPSLLRRLAAVPWAALALACAAPPPPAPPPAPVAVLDLAQVGRLGVLDFGAESEALEPVAREQFLAALRAAQPDATVRELGTRALALASVGATTFDAEAIRAIGERNQLDALLVADLRADEMDPYIFLRQAKAAPGDAVEIAGALDARIYETRSGALIWNANATGRKPITRIRISAWGQKSVDESHLQEVRVALVKNLVAQATRDFERRPASPIAGN